MLHAPCFLRFLHPSISVFLTFTLSLPVLCLLVSQCQSLAFSSSFPSPYLCPHSSSLTFALTFPSFCHPFFPSLISSFSQALLSPPPLVSHTSLYHLLFFFSFIFFLLEKIFPSFTTLLLFLHSPSSPFFPSYQKSLPLGQACLFTLE